MNENGRFKIECMLRQMKFLPDYAQFDTAEYSIKVQARWTIFTVALMLRRNQSLKEVIFYNNNVSKLYN